MRGRKRGSWFGSVMVVAAVVAELEEVTRVSIYAPLERDLGRLPILSEYPVDPRVH